LVLTVTHATRDDVPAIAGLLEELERYYGTTAFEPLPQRHAQIDQLLFGERRAVFVLLVRDAATVVGVAAYSFLWPAAGVTRSLYLKELFVARTHRRRGVGRLLWEHVRQVAVEAGCSRLEWTADRDNPDALGFYDNLGIAPHEGKVFYRLETH
jgi:GNAT superfamily N-acetyltransferase